MADHLVDTVTGNLQRHYNRQVSRIADNLRRTADRLDNEARKDDAVKDSHGIEHELRWMYANLPIDTLFAAAYELEQFKREHPEE